MAVQNNSLVYQEISYSNVKSILMIFKKSSYKQFDSLDMLTIVRIELVVKYSGHWPNNFVK